MESIASVNLDGCLFSLDQKMYQLKCHVYDTSYINEDGYKVGVRNAILQVNVDFNNVKITCRRCQNQEDKFLVEVREYEPFKNFAYNITSHKLRKLLENDSFALEEIFSNVLSVSNSIRLALRNKT